jgi:two-component system sensor histidine kinase PilS (NtrC family)
MTQQPVLPQDARPPSAHQGARFLVLGRLVVIVLSLCVMFISAAGHLQPELIAGPVLGMLVALALLNLLYLVMLPHVRRPQRFAAFQLGVDIAVVTAMIFFTRGVHSPFVYLYFAVIMAASIQLSRRLSGLYAALATIGLALVTTLHLSEVGLSFIPEAFRPEPQETWPVAARLLAVATAFFLVAYLSALLQGRLTLAQILNEEILQNMPEGVVVFDDQDRAVFMNDEFCRLFTRAGRSPLLGDALPEIFAEPEMAALRQALQEGRNYRFELEDRPEAGTDRPPLEIRIAPVGTEGRRRGLVAIFVDLSLRRRAEVAERRAERFEAVGEMAAGLAHEIRNPLASMRASLQEIASEFAADSAQGELCRIVMNASDRLDQIINEFLAFARARPLHVVTCRVRELLEEVGALLQRDPNAAAVEVAVELAEDAPPAPTLRADVEQLKGVFFNLGLNACIAMEGRGRLRFLVSRGAPPEDAPAGAGGEAGLRLSVIDTGPGLEPGTEERIFEPFFTTRPHGTGLGLSISQRVVQAHGGLLWAESEPGQGAAFHCWLPESGPYSVAASSREETGIFVRRKSEA